MISCKLIFRKAILAFLLIIIIAPHSMAQSSKKKNKSVAMWECGYAHKLSLGEKLNPMNGLQKIMGNVVTDGNNSDLGTVAISVFHQAHLHPQNIMKYPTATPRWETCGDAVFAGFTNKSGIGLSSTDGQFLVDGKNVNPAGIGTFFHSFKPVEIGNKTVKITSSNGPVAEVTVKPAASLEIELI